MTYAEKYAYYVAMIDSTLSFLLAQNEAPDILQRSMEYTIRSGGKRLRPVLCLAGCELAGGTAADAVKAACALEMIHTYSLIHDDLPAMDNDDMRRGQPSNHIAFGEGNAILAGDGLLSMAFQVLSQTESMKAIQAVAKGAFDMVCGQSLDINDSGNDKQMIFEVHKKKTGALIRASLLAGIHSAKSVNAAALQKPLSVFAEQFGLLFQITDDILDYREQEKSMMKELTECTHVEHSSFVDLYGIESALTEAEIAAQNAIHVLEDIEGDTSFLKELVDATLRRTA